MLTEERWVEVSPSQFPHEIEGLRYLKSKLPTTTPFRAWTNFEFLDSQGRWHEVDALVLARGRLHLIELKYFSGRLYGNDTQWLRDGRRAEESPLLLARRKAQRFSSKLKDELRSWAREKQVDIADDRKIIPFVQESVFLHHPGMVSEMSGTAASHLFGLDERENESNLPGISELLLEEPRADRAIGQNQEVILAELMARIGLVQRRERTAGSWIIEDGALDEGEGWQDWRAYHRVVKQDTARIRFQVADPGAGNAERVRARKIAEHEYRVMNRLSHDGLLKPRDMVESDLGVGLVYPFDESMQRLDLWIAEQGNGVSLADQLSIIRQVAEVIDYAHRNAVVHRGLSPKVVWIARSSDRLRVQVSDWQTAGAAAAVATGLSGDDGVTRLFGADQTSVASAAGDDAWLTEAFRAPEGRWSAAATDRVGLDVFGLGALAYYVVTMARPAASSLALAERLREQGGLDIAPVLPQVSEALRKAVLDATRPVPRERLRTVQDFLNALDRSAPGPRDSEPDTDPLDAVPGTLLGDGRFTVLRRLGKGSTAQGLMVKDSRPDGIETERVLKVALNVKAADRLTAEAEVIGRLRGPRLATLVEGPFDLNGRTVLLLESAGSQTLDELIRDRGGRLSIDLLERFGVDLLDAVAALDKAGIDHRDIKPSNLGVREDSRKAKHLVLFDFSLSRAPAAALDAGTPPYLDPFLGGVRPRFDSAAERYAAAVVLFEMATGHRPYYGDPLANPAAVPDEATVDPKSFDPSVAGSLTEFFRRALARDASLRHDTAAEMLAVWRGAFSHGTTTAPEDADELAAKAKLETELEAAGLSARALSALEPFGVRTVGDLTAVDAVRLNRLSGVAESTRKEVKSRAKQWRDRFGTGGRETDIGALPPVEEIAKILTDSVSSARSPGRGQMAALILGAEGHTEAFATQAQLAAALPTPVTSGRANQILEALHKAWAENTEALGILRSLESIVDERLDALGKVASINELAATILRSSTGARVRDDIARRTALGLLRIVVDRRRAQLRAEEELGAMELRRRDGRALAIAREPGLLDIAEALGRDADALLIGGPYGGELIPADRARASVVPTAQSVAADNPRLLEGTRLVRLAAEMSRTAAFTGAAELYRRDLDQAKAVALTFQGISTGERLSPKEIQDRVHARFPALADLPRRPSLDTLLDQAGLGLKFDEGSQWYYSPTEGGDTTGLHSYMPTVVASQTDDIDGGSVARRLEESSARRSFLTLGCPADRIDKLVNVLELEFNARVLDLTGILMDEMKRLANERAVPPWEILVAADAQPGESRAGKGLAAVVKRALPAVELAISEAVMQEDDGGTPRPVLLTEAAPLARYGHAHVLRRLSDLAVARGQAVWLVVPQLAANQGPLLDGVPVQTSPNQFVRFDHIWVDTKANTILKTAPAIGVSE